MREGLFYFRQPRQDPPSLSPMELCDFVNERGVHVESHDAFYGLFDVLCHVQGVLYYRMRQTERATHDIDPMEVFTRRDYFSDLLEGDNDLVHVIHTHDHDDLEPHEVLENSHTISLAEFRGIVARHVEKGELVLSFSI